MFAVWKVIDGSVLNGTQLRTATGVVATDIKTLEEAKQILNQQESQCAIVERVKDNHWKVCS